MSFRKLLKKIEKAPYNTSNNVESLIKGLTIIDEVYNENKNKGLLNYSNIENKIFEKVNKYCDKKSLKNFLNSVKTHVLNYDRIGSDLNNLRNENPELNVESTIGILRNLREKHPINGRGFDYPSFMTGVKILSTIIKPVYEEYKKDENKLVSLCVNPIINKYAKKLNDLILNYKHYNN